MLSTLAVLFVLLILVSLACWGVQAFLPVPPTLKNLICAVVVAFAILWMLGAVGAFRGTWHPLW